MNNILYPVSVKTGEVGNYHLIVLADLKLVEKERSLNFLIGIIVAVNGDELEEEAPGQEHIVIDIEIGGSGEEALGGGVAHIVDGNIVTDESAQLLNINHKV